MFSDSNRRVIIAGGGIGGLSSAIALAQAGFPAQVLEQAAEFSEVGAGIQLGPNAVLILRMLGAADALMETAAQPEGLHIFDALSGDSLTTIPFGSYMEMRHGAPYLVAHRADLQRALLQAAANHDTIDIANGFRVTRYELGNSSVTIVGESGETLTGGALVGADGLHSKVREQMQPSVKPVFSGKTAWRTVVPMGEAPSVLQQNAVGLWLSPKAHLVHYPVQKGETLNIVAVIDDARSPEGWAEPGDPARLIPHFEGWPGIIRDFLARRPDWRRWSLYRMAPLPRWSCGRVTLLGDAAHPVLPFLASGGVLAIEDAAVLAQSLILAKGDPVTAFQTYQQARRRRAEQVQKHSRWLGTVYHASGLMRWGRNQVLTMRSPEDHLRQHDWLYGYRVAET